MPQNPVSKIMNGLLSPPKRSAEYPRSEVQHGRKRVRGKVQGVKSLSWTSFIRDNERIQYPEALKSYWRARSTITLLITVQNSLKLAPKSAEHPACPVSAAIRGRHPPPPAHKCVRKCRAGTGTRAAEGLIPYFKRLRQPGAAHPPVWVVWPLAT